MAVLVTGGAGYIGSHALVELASAGLEFIVFDNLSNSSKESLNRVESIIGREIPFEEGDIRDRERLRELFTHYKIDSVIHFAGLKAVGESVEKPLEYYDNNIVGTIRLLETMQEFGCKNILFSSSATVYGESATMPIKEDFQTGIGITNPYGRSKYMIEEILKDLYRSDESWKIVILRYFNPVGAHKSGLIGEDPNGIPNNLMPYISQVAVGTLKELQIFGDDYNTVDGTGVRDYIHVVDLANAHLKAIEYIATSDGMSKPLIVNIGTGKGYSVLEVVEAFKRASAKELPCKIVGRREGDIATCFADASRAKETLNWDAQYDIDTMCIDSWRWQSRNPNGYKG